MKRWREIPVFIHGVVPGLGRRQGKEYELLYRKICETPGGAELFDEKPIKVEWGWKSGYDRQAEDKFLADAQLWVTKLATQAAGRHLDLPIFLPAILLRPLIYDRARKAFVERFSDMFYYVSEQGEKSVRDTVFGYLCGRVLEILDKENDSTGVSLTFFTHSAGSVIAHDLLYHLFGEKDREDEIDNKRDVTRLREFARPCCGTDPRLRVRKLYTMGSPITPLLFRSNKKLEELARRKDDESFEPEDKARVFDPRQIGLGPSGDTGIANPRWLNFYDKDDLLGYPLEFLYERINNEKVVEDRCVGIGIIFPRVHNKYWSSRKVVRQMVDNLTKNAR